MYFSSGNYEAFARPRKPEGVENKTAWFVGSEPKSLSQLPMNSKGTVLDLCCSNTLSNWHVETEFKNFLRRHWQQNKPIVVFGGGLFAWEQGVSR